MITKVVLCSAVLIYSRTAHGAKYVSYNADGRLGGVLVGGDEPFLFESTSNVSTYPLITVGGVSGIQNDAAYRIDTVNVNVRTLNPDVLGPHVHICQTEIYYDGDIPRWCAYANHDETFECANPFDTECDGGKVDRLHVWSWSDDGMYLYKRLPPDDTALAITASVGILLLAVAEAGAEHGATLPQWALYDAVGWSVGTSLLAGGDWTACLVHGVAIGSTIAFRNQQSPLAAKALATSIAVTVSLAVPTGAIGAGATSLLRLVIAIIIAGFAGKRGALWALPFAYKHGLLPLVLQSAALDLREPWVAPVISSLLAASLALLGFSASRPEATTWYDYLTMPRLFIKNGRSRSRVVPFRATGRSGPGTFM